MKFSWLLLVLFALILLPGAVYAQTATLPDALPGTAQDALSLFSFIAASFCGLLVTTLVRAIRNATFLTDEDKDRISGPAADFLTAVLSVSLGYGLGYLGYIAGLLDQSGIWQLAVFTWPAAKLWYEQYQSRKLAEKATAAY